MSFFGPRKKVKLLSDMFSRNMTPGPGQAGYSGPTVKYSDLSSSQKSALSAHDSSGVIRQSNASAPSQAVISSQGHSASSKISAPVVTIRSQIPSNERANASPSYLAKLGSPQNPAIPQYRAASVGSPQNPANPNYPVGSPQNPVIPQVWTSQIKEMQNEARVNPSLNRPWTSQIKEIQNEAKVNPSQNSTIIKSTSSYMPSTVNKISISPSQYAENLQQKGKLKVEYVDKIDSTSGETITGMFTGGKTPTITIANSYDKEATMAHELSHYKVYDVMPGKPGSSITNLAYNIVATPSIPYKYRPNEILARYEAAKSKGRNTIKVSEAEYANQFNPNFEGRVISPITSVSYDRSKIITMVQDKPYGNYRVVEIKPNIDSPQQYLANPTHSIGSPQNPANPNYPVGSPQNPLKPDLRSQ